MQDSWRDLFGVGPGFMGLWALEVPQSSGFFLRIILETLWLSLLKLLLVGVQFHRSFKKSHFLEILVHIRNDNGMAASQGLQAVQDLAAKKEKIKESSPFLLIVPMLSFFRQFQFNPRSGF